MGATSLSHWLIVALVIAVVFGSKRIPGLMGDLAGGIRAFKRAMAAPDDAADTTLPSTTPPITPVPQASSVSKGTSHG